VQAELVAFRVAQDIGQRPAVAVRFDQLRTKPDQSFDIGRLLSGTYMDVKMHPILGDLAFRYTLKEQPRLDSRRVAARSHVPERGTAINEDSVVDRHPTIGNQLVDEHRMILDYRAVHLRPEHGLGMWIAAIERHLSPHGHPSCQTPPPGRDPQASTGRRIVV